jgi:hypothetical protein
MVSLVFHFESFHLHSDSIDWVGFQWDYTFQTTCYQKAVLLSNPNLILPGGSQINGESEERLIEHIILSINFVWFRKIVTRTWGQVECTCQCQQQTRQHNAQL